jgi:2-C-methyl-D-erythritol 4-phosphate cytidylyltransferase
LKVEVVIVAAGRGKRLPGSELKQFYPLRGKPIFCWTIDKFEKCKLIDKIILAVPPGKEEYVRKKILSPFKYKKIKTVVKGGEKRGDSVFQGLKIVDEDTDIILIHDGVRPLISLSLIEKVIKEANKYGAVSLGIPIKETIKEIKNDNMVAKTLKRERLYLTQTPQGFKREVIWEAYKEARSSGWRANDDTGLVEKLGHKVKMLLGEETNIKITTSLDLKLAEILLGEASRCALG